MIDEKKIDSIFHELMDKYVEHATDSNYSIAFCKATAMMMALGVPPENRQMAIDELCKNLRVEFATFSKVMDMFELQYSNGDNN